MDRLHQLKPVRAAPVEIVTAVQVVAARAAPAVIVHAVTVAATNHNRVAHARSCDQ